MEEELKIKQDFSDCYRQDNPRLYLQEMAKVDYRVADTTKPFYEYLANRLYKKLGREINIMDLGSSYGINSSLLKYDLSVSDLEGFFVTKFSRPPTMQETLNFYKTMPEYNPHFKFYLIDISQPALQFASKAGLCTKVHCINLDKEKPTAQFKEDMKQIDVVISTGAVGYIGAQTFAQILECMKQRKQDHSGSQKDAVTPIFAMSVLRIFSVKEITKVFDSFDFSLFETKIPSFKQRRFYNEKEKNETLKLLKEKGINTKDFEENGFMYADLYVGCPKKGKKTFSTWVEDMERIFSKALHSSQ